MRYELLLQRVSRLDVCELVENDGRQQLHWNTVRRSALLQLVLIFAQLSDVPLTAAPGSVFHLLHQGVAEYPVGGDLQRLPRQHAKCAATGFVQCRRLLTKTCRSWHAVSYPSVMKVCHSLYTEATHRVFVWWGRLWGVARRRDGR